jgi:hypothetical protein
VYFGAGRNALQHLPTRLLGRADDCHFDVVGPNCRRYPLDDLFRGLCSEVRALLCSALLPQRCFRARSDSMPPRDLV